jgi:uncharacterized protein (TIRG00374 family)
MTMIRWRNLIGLFFSVVFLYFAFRDVPLGEVAAIFPTILPGYIILAVVVSILTLMAKAARWRFFFTERRPTFKQSFSIQTIGIFVNSVTPARLGDLLRAYLFSEQNHHSKVFVLGTIMVEKIFDLLFLVVSIVILLPQVVFPNWVSQPSELTAILLIVLMGIIGLMAWKKERVSNLIEKISPIFPAKWRQWILRQLHNLLSSLECVRNWKQLLGIVAWSGIIWVLGFLTNILVFWSLNLPISFLPAIFLLVVLQVGVAVPSSPGRIGIFHYSTVLALSVFEIEKSPALSCGIILHLVVYLPLTILGAFFMWNEKIDWGKIKDTIMPFTMRKKST